MYCIRIRRDSNLDRHKLLLIKIKKEKKSNMRSQLLIRSALYQKKISSIFSRLKLTYVVFMLKNVYVQGIHVYKVFFFSFSASISLHALNVH